MLLAHMAHLALHPPDLSRTHSLFTPETPSFCPGPPAPDWCWNYPPEGDTAGVFSLDFFPSSIFLGVPRLGGGWLSSWL